MHPPAPIDLDLNAALSRKISGAPPWQWFGTRLRTLHAATASQPKLPLAPPEAAARLRSALADPAGRDSRPRALYIHIPFCQRLCPFCAFFRTSSAQSDLEQYVAALHRQIERTASTPWAQSRPIDAVYFGGGTPTSLSPAQLTGLIGLIRDRFPVGTATEITVESRFLGIDAAYLRALADAGVTRLSLGAQSFDTELRQRLSRVVPRDSMLQIVAQAVAAGIPAVNVDLIYNLPAQSDDLWAADLDTATKLPLSGISAYALSVFEDCRLAKMIEQGILPPVGGIAEEYRFHGILEQAFADRPQWARISPTHYGRVGSETNVYNGMRDRVADLLGLGAGGGGRIGPLHYMNTPSIESFVRHTAGGGMESVMGSLVEDCPHADSMLKLVSELTLPATALAALPLHLTETISQLIELGLLKGSRRQLSLTADGRFWAYNLAAVLTAPAPVEARHVSL